MGTPKKAAKPPAPSPRVAGLTTKERARIRARTLAKDQTIRKWADGYPVREQTNMVLTEACGELGIEVLG